MNIETVLKDLGIGVGGKASNIKSMQKGYSTLADDTTTKTLTIPINQIDLTKSIVIATIYNGNSGMYTNGDTLAAKCVSVRLTSATTLTINRTSAYGIIEVVWAVIEFKQLKSRQSGNFTATALSTSIGINEVNPEKCLLAYTFESTVTGTSASMRNYPTLLRLKDNLTLDFKQRESHNKTVFWQLVEFE